MGTPTSTSGVRGPAETPKPGSPSDVTEATAADPAAAKDVYVRTKRGRVVPLIAPPAAPLSILVRKPPKAKVVAKPPMVLVPLDDAPVETAAPKESLHRAREAEPVPTLLKPDFGVSDQPADEKIGSHQPWSLAGGYQPKEELPAPPKIRGEKQAVASGEPVLGELPPSLMGGPLGPKTVQGFSLGVPCTYRNDKGDEITTFKEISE